MYTQGPTGYQPSYGAAPASVSAPAPTSSPPPTFGAPDQYQPSQPPMYAPPPPYQKPPSAFNGTTMTMAGLGALIGLLLFPFGWPILIGAGIGFGVGLLGQ